MPAVDRVAIEVNVGVQILPRSVLVGAAAEVMRIVEQIRYPGDRRDQVQKAAALDLLVEFGKGRPQFADPFHRALVAQFSGLVAGVALVEIRELGEHPRQEILGEEIVDEHMAKGFAPGKGLCQQRDARR